MRNRRQPTMTIDFQKKIEKLRQKEVESTTKKILLFLVHKFNLEPDLITCGYEKHKNWSCEMMTYRHSGELILFRTHQFSIFDSIKFISPLINNKSN